MNIKNQLIFVKDMDNYKVGRFFETQCSPNIPQRRHWLYHRTLWPLTLLIHLN